MHAPPEDHSQDDHATWQPRHGRFFKALVWTLLAAIALGSIALMAAVLMM